MPRETIKKQLEAILSSDAVKDLENHCELISVLELKGELKRCIKKLDKTPTPICRPVDDEEC